MKKIIKFYDSKYFNILLFLIYFMIPFIVYFNLFEKNMVPLSGDGVQYFSMKLFINNALKSGQLPLWDPYLSNGVPFAADFNGVFYPVSLILSILPAKLFIYCYYSLHLAIGAFFIYLFLKEINCDKVVAIGTSFIYIMSIHLGGYRKSHMSIICAIVFLPVILYFIEKYVKDKKIRYLLCVTLAMGLQFLGGGVQYGIYTDATAFVYLIFRMYCTKVQFKKMMKALFLLGITYATFIAVQLLPSMELLRTYKQAGSGDISYDYFASYSIHPIKIIMMLFPNLFGTEVMQPLGANYSSEMDIEIFLGVGILMMILFAIANYRKDQRVIISCIFMLGSFIYASCAHIPILNKFVYHTPVLGGLRCAGRALFVFIFFGYVLFAVALTKLREEDDLKGLKDFVIKIFIFICGVLVVMSPLLYLLSSDLSRDALLSRSNNLKLTLIMPLITLLILSVAFVGLEKRRECKKNNLKSIYLIINMLMFVITLFETTRFSFLNDPTSVNNFKASSIVTEKVKKEIDNKKLWLANNTIDGGYRSIIEFNSNVSMEIPAINAYIAFNNPRLFRLFTNKNIMEPKYNYSGLLTGFPDAYKNLLLQNDLLSMLGVKFILDPLKLISDNGDIVSSMIDDSLIYTKDKVELPYTNGQMYVFQEPIKLEPNTFYKISFHTNSISDQTSFYADLYGGNTYDNAEQNMSFSIKKGQNSHCAYFNSGDSNVSNEIYLRFVTIPTSEIMITDVKVTKMHAQMKAGAYKQYYVDDANRVYINTNAKDILYIPTSVESVRNVEDIYDNVYSYDLDDISYIENMDGFSTAAGTLKDICWKRNSISANVTTEGRTFINFSQNYYPGWKAYIDGKETKDYMVNGLIQGIEVPSGNHFIEFKFIPVSIIIGAIISALSLLFMICVIIREIKVDKSIKSSTV